MVTAIDNEVKVVKNFNLAVPGKPLVQGQQIGAGRIVISRQTFFAQFFNGYQKPAGLSLQQHFHGRQHVSDRALQGDGSIVHGSEMGAPGGNVAGIVDEDQQAQALVLQLRQDAVQFQATGLIKPLVGIFNQQRRDSPGNLLEQAEFPGLTGAQLPVAPVQGLIHRKERDQFPVLFGIGQKITGRGAGIDLVEEIGVILADFILENCLLPLERANAEVGRQPQQLGPEIDLFTGDHVAEQRQPRVVGANEAPGLLRPGNKLANMQPAC